MHRLQFALLLLLLLCSPSFAQYEVKVQVVDLQVSVSDANGDFITNVTPEDFVVREDGVLQEVLDIEAAREPFSIGILLDTSSSMKSDFLIAARATTDFLSALQPEDEYFVMTFDDRMLIKKDFGPAIQKTALKLNELRYGESTHLYDALLSGIDLLEQAQYPRRALFLVSDGLNTGGKGDLRSVIQLAQRNKILVYSLVVDDNHSELNALKILTSETGGSYFDLYSDTPRLLVAYQKIAQDLAHRFTLYYHSTSDYSNGRKPVIQLETKNPHWRVRYQKTYYPQ